MTIHDLDVARRERSGNDPWMTKQQLAQHLGFSVRWVEYRLREGMPHRRIGGLVRIQAPAALAWLDQREKAA